MPPSRCTATDCLELFLAYKVRSAVLRVGVGEVDLFVKEFLWGGGNTYHDMICKNLVFFVFLYTLIRDSDKETKFELLQADSHIKSFLLFFSTHCLN